jgi:excisionase family DNA binding protein
MVLFPALSRRKLSTARLWQCDHADNREMTNATSHDTFGRFLTISDTAEVLNVSVSYAYSLVRSGELPAIRIGSRGQWRIEKNVLESYIEAKYEEVRRSSLWNQSDYANVAHFAFGEDYSRTINS